MKGFTKLFGTFLALLVMVGTSSLLHAVPRETQEAALFQDCETGERSFAPIFSGKQDQADHKETPKNVELLEVQGTPDFSKMSVEELQDYLRQTQIEIIRGQVQVTSELEATLEQAVFALQQKVSQLSEEKQEAFKQEMLQQAQQAVQGAKHAENPGIVRSTLALIYQSFIGATSFKLIVEPVFGALGTYVISPVLNYTVIPVANACAPAATYVKNALFGAPTAAQLAAQAQAEAQQKIAIAAATQAHKEFMNNVGEKIGTNTLFGHKYLSFLKEKSPEILQLGTTIATFGALYALTQKASEVTGVGAAVSNWYYGKEHKKEIKKYNKDYRQYSRYMSATRKLESHQYNTSEEREVLEQVAQKRRTEPQLSVGAYTKMVGAGVAQTFASLAGFMLSASLVNNAFGYMFVK